jgi:hypothetical protein
LFAEGLSQPTPLLAGARLQDPPSGGLRRAEVLRGRHSYERKRRRRNEVWILWEVRVPPRGNDACKDSGSYEEVRTPVGD